MGRLIGNPPRDGQVERMVKDMRVGEQGYMDVGGLLFDTAGIAYLRLTAYVSKKRTWHNEVLIRRTGEGDEDYVLDVRKCKHLWSSKDEPLSEENEQYKQDVVALSYAPKGYKLPSHNPRRVELEQLLSAAVRVEDYEEAARCRDRLKKLGSGSRKRSKGTKGYSTRRKNNAANKRARQKSPFEALPGHLL